MVSVHRADTDLATRLLHKPGTIWCAIFLVAVACTFLFLLCALATGWASFGTVSQSQAELLTREGIEFYWARNFEQAEEILKRALQLQPGNLQARIHLVRTLIQSDKVPEALREIRILLELHPRDPEAKFETGRLLQELAGSRFAKIERLAPDSSEAHELLGKYYEARGRLKEALAEYRFALERNPKGPGLHFLIGNIYWKLGNFDAAVPELERELRLNPNHTLANHRIGHIYVFRHQATEALPYLEKAVRADPGAVAFRRDLGKALRLLGRFEEALREFTFVAEKEPDDDTVHFQLAAVYKALGDPKRAAEELAIHERILQERREASQRK